MADVVELKRKPKRREVDATIGMLIFLGGWAMMFAGLFFAYAALRWKAPVWPPAGLPRPPLALPSASTLALAFSSALVWLALRNLRAGRARSLLPLIVGAIALGVTFVVMQGAVWQHMRALGLRPSSGIYGGVFFGIQGLHAVHALAGLVGLGTLLPGATAGRYTAASHTALRVWAMFWHFVGAMWLVTWVTVYLL